VPSLSPTTDLGSLFAQPNPVAATPLAPGPFGAAAAALPQPGSSARAPGQPAPSPTTAPAATSAITNGQARPIAVQPVATSETGPDRAAPQAQARTSPWPKLLGILSVPDLLKFLGALLAAIVLAIAGALQALLEAILGGPQGVIFQTPPEFTVHLGPVLVAWNAMRLIAEAGLALIVLVAGYGLVSGHLAGLPHAAPRQVVPRVILGFILIHYSLEWSGWVLQLNNTLSHMLLGAVPTNWGIHPTATDLGSAVAWLIEVAMMLLLALSMWLRIALLDVLLVLAPLMLLLWTNPLTSEWGAWWGGLFTSTAFVQFFQDIALWLGSQLLTGAGDGAGQTPALSSRVLAFMFLLLVFRIPQLMPALPASGGTASFLGLSRGAGAIASLPLIGSVLPGGRAGGSGRRRAGGSGGSSSRSGRQGRGDRSKSGGQGKGSGTGGGGGEA